MYSAFSLMFNTVSIEDQRLVATFDLSSVSVRRRLA